MLIHQYSQHNQINSNNSTNNSHTNTLNSPKQLGVNGNIVTGDDMNYERGGVLRSYPNDIHMNSLSNVWNPSTLNINENRFDSCLSSFQLIDTSTTPVHLIILQHGFQGTSFDMRLIRNALHIEFPHFMVVFIFYFTKTN